MGGSATRRMACGVEIGRVASQATCPCGKGTAESLRLFGEERGINALDTHRPAPPPQGSLPDTDSKPGKTSAPELTPRKLVGLSLVLELNKLLSVPQAKKIFWSHLGQVIFPRPKVRAF